MNVQTTTITQPVIPAFYFERWQYQEEMPLGAYGCELLKNLRHEYPERYWQLSFEGKLMKTVREREIELIDMKFLLMQSLEKKFPRPVTGDFLAIAAHMNQIDEEAERVIKRELRKAV